MANTNDNVISLEELQAFREEVAKREGKPKPRKPVNANYTSFVINKAQENTLKFTKENEVKSIKVFDANGKEIKYGTLIKAGEEYTYKVTAFDERNPKKIEFDKKTVIWNFWLHKTQKQLSKKIFRISTKTEVKDFSKDFLVNKKNKNERTDEISKKAILYAKSGVIEEDGKKVSILKVKFSKWLDKEKIKVVAYLKTRKTKGDTVATRVLKAKPEIIDAYWLNAEGRKITNTGYKQDVYLYLKTLGLTGKTLETLVFDEDTHPNPLPLVSTDDPIAWKNNKIKIDKRDVIKQFKVGNKKRYEGAQADEKAEEPLFKTFVDFGVKSTYNLELYINIKNGEALKIENLKQKYGRLNLYTDEKILSVFFAKKEEEIVQGDAPYQPVYIKDKKTGKSIKTKAKKPPETKVPYYEKLEQGAIGQKVQLVASCANLNGKEVLFKLHEKEPLLVAKDTVIGVIQNGAEVTEIKAIVKDGYAVAEIELKHCKQDKDNDDWTKILFPDTVKKKDDIKTTNLFVKVTCKGDILTHKKEFLNKNYFNLTTNTCGCKRCINYQDVWESPEINNQSENENKNRYERVLRYNSSHPSGYYHKGADILTGSTYKELHSLLCGKVVYTKSSFTTNKYQSGSLGNIITVKSKDKNEKVIFIMYCHLDRVDVKKGDTVIHGQNIGLSGSTGNAAEILDKNGNLKKGIKQEYWHVHIEAATTYGYSATMRGQSRKDPELFMKTKFDSDGKSIK